MVPSPSDDGFTVSVNPEIAFTIVYTDSHATLVFCIEPVNNSLIHLDSGALSGGKVVDEQTRALEWYKTAVVRVADFLGKHGAKVVINQ